MTTYDIAILGAGFAGLVCARQLAAKGFSVLVVEVRPSALELAARAGPIDRSDSLLTRFYLSFPSQGRNRTGGRARSYVDGGHAPVDLGCSWIHGFEQGTPVRALVEGLGIVCPCSLVVPSIVPDLGSSTTPRCSEA
jgi:threonine dehydrogenase-like Zn-dependent dehydrogenase